MAKIGEDGKVIRHGKMGRWRPKTWRPEYDRIVAYSSLGKSNVWIAETLHFTPEHVSTILNQPQAKDLMAVLAAKLRDNITVNIPQVLDEVAQKTASRIKEMMYDDELYAKSPFQVIDRGLDVLKGLNHLRGGGNGALPSSNVTNIGTVVIAPEHRSDILAGLEKVNEIKRIHSGSTVTVSPSEE